MPERFSRLFQIGEDLYLPGSPIAINNGALLKDSLTGAIIVQLKFQNLCKRVISAAKVEICAYDTFGNIVGGIDNYQYCDLSIGHGMYWGSDKAIIMPDASTRAFSIKKIEIIFNDNGTWETDCAEEFSSVPKGKLLEEEISDPELVKQYKIAVNQNAKYAPSQYEDGLWRCSCGSLNLEERCGICHAEKNRVFLECDIKTLAVRAHERLLKEQALQKEREIQEEQTAQKKRRRNNQIKIGVGIIAAIVAVVIFYRAWLFPHVLYPNNQYNNAVELYQGKQYNEARSILQGLGDYKDSKDLIEDIPYQKAEDLFELGEYEDAIEAFDRLGDYKDSHDRVLQISYEYAEKLQLEGNYLESLEWFQSVGTYSESKPRVSELQDMIYKDGMSLFENGDYEAALEYFEAIPGVLDSDHYVDMCNYFSGMNYYNSGRYADALTHFRNLPLSFTYEGATMSTLVEQAEIASTYVYCLDVLENANDLDASVDYLTSMIDQYNELRDRGEAITGKSLSLDKAHMVELYNLYSGYVGTYYPDFGRNSIEVKMYFYPGTADFDLWVSSPIGSDSFHLKDGSLSGNGLYIDDARITLSEGPNGPIATYVNDDYTQEYERGY